MKKIALLHFAYPPNTGGVEILLREHAIVFTELGYEVTVLTGSGEEKNPKIKFFVLPEFQSVLNFNPSLQKKILEEGKIDEDFYQLAKIIEDHLEHYLKNQEIIIVHNMLTIVRNLPFVYAFRNFIKKHPEKKYIAWVHDHSYIHEQKIKDLDRIINSKLERELLTNPLAGVTYVTISEIFKKALIQLLRLQADKVSVILNGINLKRFLEIDNVIWNIVEKYKLLNAFPLILQPVNLLGRKNIEYSIDILNQLRKDFPLVRLIITGNPSRHRSTEEYLKNLKNKIKSLNLDSCVIFFHEFLSQSLDESALHDLYVLSDVVFYFSKSENFGLPLLEAELSKIPIFVSNLEVFHEIGKDYIMYIDYKTTSVASAADMIKSYITTSKLTQGHYFARTNSDLKTILIQKLIPLF